MGNTLREIAKITGKFNADGWFTFTKIEQQESHVPKTKTSKGDDLHMVAKISIKKDPANTECLMSEQSIRLPPLELDDTMELVPIVKSNAN